MGKTEMLGRDIEMLTKYHALGNIIKKTEKHMKGARK
jgi:hypothetical protein